MHIARPNAMNKIKLYTYLMWFTLYGVQNLPNALQYNVMQCIGIRLNEKLLSYQNFIPKNQKVTICNMMGAAHKIVL